uniref:Chloroplast thioredoxin M-type n=1 Tax=Zea mays TaxID=4577 RepID=G0YVY7_MAIZE|nr:chloroplast thioredoxin M-type precursor [Zea mays]
MAMETCFRAWSLSIPAGSKDRLLVGNLQLLPSKRPHAPLSVSRISMERPRHVCQSKNIVQEVVVADEKNWDSLLIACETPVLVEFWAPWLGPSRMIAPKIHSHHKHYTGHFTCCKVNTYDSPNVASIYVIRSIPTVLIFKGGENKESVIGAVPKSTLTTLLDKYIGSS